MYVNDLNFSQLLHLLNNYEFKNKIRLLERQHKQILAAKSGIKFNQTCLTEGLFPIFTSIYTLGCPLKGPKKEKFEFANAYPLLFFELPWLTHIQNFSPVK